MDSETNGPTSSSTSDASSGSKPASAAAASPPSDSDFEALLASFARLGRTREPIAREIARLNEAKLLGLRERRYTALLEIYNQERLPRWLLEPKLKRLVDWFARLSLFKLLGYIGRFAVLLAIISFIAECPDRHRQAQYANLRIVE